MRCDRLAGCDGRRRRVIQIAIRCSTCKCGTTGGKTLLCVEVSGRKGPQVGAGRVQDRDPVGPGEYGESRRLIQRDTRFIQRDSQTNPSWSSEWLGGRQRRLVPRRTFGRVALARRRAVSRASRASREVFEASQRTAAGRPKWWTFEAGLLRCVRAVCAVCEPCVLCVCCV